MLSGVLRETLFLLLPKEIKSFPAILCDRLASLLLFSPFSLLRPQQSLLLRHENPASLATHSHFFASRRLGSSLITRATVLKLLRCPLLFRFCRQLSHATVSFSHSLFTSREHAFIILLS